MKFLRLNMSKGSQVPMGLQTIEQEYAKTGHKYAKK